MEGACATYPQLVSITLLSTPSTRGARYWADEFDETGAAASTAETRKKTKYAVICRGVDFVPVAVETSGAWGKEGWALVKELGRRIGVVKREPRSTEWLRQRISLAIQRGNAYCILATPPTGATDVVI